MEKVEGGEGQKIYTCVSTNIRSRGDSIYLKYITNLRRKKAQGGGEPTYLQGPADNNLKNKSLNEMKRSPQGTGKM